MTPNNGDAPEAGTPAVPYHVSKGLVGLLHRSPDRETDVNDRRLHTVTETSSE